VPPNVDRDNDLRRDTRDNCPDDPNPDQSDFDSDGRGDVCDDCDAGESADVDNDGIPDGCDGCIGIGLDSDMDMVDDACDDNACSAPAGDPDTDGDGVTDTCDRCAGSPEHDEDSDGYPDACDNCPARKNPDQADTLDDGPRDGLGDACDPETFANTADFTPFTDAEPRWYVQGVGFDVTDDALNTVSGPTRTFVLLPQLFEQGFYVQTTVTSRDPMLATGSELGVLVSRTLDAQPSFEQIVCVLRIATPQSATLTLEVATNGAWYTSSFQGMPSGPPWSIVLEHARYPSKLGCRAAGLDLAIVPGATPLPTGPFYAGVLANAPVAFEYLYAHD